MRLEVTYSGNQGDRNLPEWPRRRGNYFLYTKTGTYALSHANASGWVTEDRTPTHPLPDSIIQQRTPGNKTNNGNS